LKFKKIHLIVAAGGIGKRMGTPVPKQYLEIRNTPLILLTARRIVSRVSIHQIIIVCPAELIEKTKTIFNNFNVPVQVTAGGKERYYSIKNALEFLPDATDECVLIHDAVRPFVADHTLMKTIESCEISGVCVPVVPLKESIRQINVSPTLHANRSHYAVVQTPQCFRCDIIKKAYSLPYDPLFTDDASVVEKAGYAVSITEGNPENIKITEPPDLFLADYYYERFFE
jgi:2-C-methyl-D-erythritol 4-phosphate cytidylyltransferase